MEKPRITIIDYGMGNLASVSHAFTHIGCSVQIVSERARILAAERLVFPGVGAFPEAIARVREEHLDEAILAVAARGTPVLGICLGMQLMFAGSQEFGYRKGLGLFADTIERMDVPLKTPHMGWNQVRDKAGCPLLAGIDGEAFYFVHSYWAPDTSAPHAAGITNYGRDFVSVAQQGNVFGVQFHPEKSSEAGLALLQNFVTL
nr:imidazole glycerol phosphate synthase subunit HisH [Maliibacterium massiliense]